MSDCCCSYAATERLNRDEIQPVLEHLVKTNYFKYFKVDLYCECPLWPEDGMCSLRDCSVCECEPEEVPEPWRAVEGLTCDNVKKQSDVDRSIQPAVKEKLVQIRDWRGWRNPWMPSDNDDGTNNDEVEYSYINLVVNQEKYTGYKGEHANRVWSAIYSQEALQDINTHHEKKVFYKLISGVHASISAHLSAKYLIDEATDTWGPNLMEFRRRLGNSMVRDRVENLYFAYLFVLRAVMKAKPLLAAVDFNTGTPIEDAKTKELMTRLINNEALSSSCPTPFDEGRLWKQQDAMELKPVLQATFQNITRVMDCVGCEKCKMWGKLQFLGIATSLKILFSEADCAEQGGDLTLERNELIALVNLLERLSTSVEVVRSLSLALKVAEEDGSLPKEDGWPNSFGAIQGFTNQPLAPQLKQ